MRAWIERFGQAMHIHDAPWRLALSLAVGVFISFTPFYGLQTLMAIGVAFVFRLNRAATVGGAWINLPWFAPLVYGSGLKLGALILPELTGLGGLSVTLLIGTTILGMVASVLTYVIALRVISRRRARQAKRPRPDSSDRSAA